MNEDVPRHDTWTPEPFRVRLGDSPEDSEPVLVTGGETFAVWGVGQALGDRRPRLTHLPSGAAVEPREMEAGPEALKALGERLESADVPSDDIETILEHADDYKSIIDDWKEDTRD